MPSNDAEYISNWAITYKIDVSIMPLGCIATAKAESRMALISAIPL